MFVKNGLHGGIFKIKNTCYCNYTLFAYSFSYYSDNNALKVLIPYTSGSQSMWQDPQPVIKGWKDTNLC